MSFVTTPGQHEKTSPGNVIKHALDQERNVGVYRFKKGGPGSGNFGHVGRPGEVGGSSGEGGGGEVAGSGSGGGDGSITYTFPADSKIPELRGKTVTGGEFYRIDGDWKQEPDAVRFKDRIDGKTVIARITGKPELEAALATHQKTKQETANRLTTMGWDRYRNIQGAMINATEAYDRASERGYPIKEAAALRTAENALAAARVKYPHAALYARAESYTMAENDQKASAGRKAMRAIEGGADPAATVQRMDAEWSAAAERSVDRA